MLSKENREKIINTGLYRAAPDRKLQSWYDNPYWCKNWTFVVRISNDELYEEYDENDVYYVSTDSGGMTMGKTYRKKCAKRPVKRMVELMEHEIESLESQLKSAKKELETYKDGTHWKLK